MTWIYEPTHYIKAVHVYKYDLCVIHWLAHGRWRFTRCVLNLERKFGVKKWAKCSYFLESSHAQDLAWICLFCSGVYGSIKCDDFMGFLCPAWEFYCTCAHCIQLITEVLLKRSIAPVKESFSILNQSLRCRVMVTHLWLTLVKLLNNILQITYI